MEKAENKPAAALRAVVSFRLALNLAASEAASPTYLLCPGLCAFLLVHHHSGWCPAAHSGAPHPPCPRGRDKELPSSPSPLLWTNTQSKSQKNPAASGREWNEEGNCLKVQERLDLVHGNQQLPKAGAGSPGCWVIGDRPLLAGPPMSLLLVLFKEFGLKLCGGCLLLSFCSESFTKQHHSLQAVAWRGNAVFSLC